MEVEDVTVEEVIIPNQEGSRSNEQAVNVPQATVIVEAADILLDEKSQKPSLTAENAPHIHPLIGMEGIRPYDFLDQ